jgi:hypothetical protein
VDRDGTMVDLYGYTSMLVAAVQAQGEALAKLQTELAQVKRGLRAKQYSAISSPSISTRLAEAAPIGVV